MSRTYPHLQFAEDVLKRLDLPVTRQNVQAMLAWQKAEGGHTDNTADWNPLNTSRVMGNAGTVNSHGVRAYRDYETGVRATVETLRLGYYDAVRAALRKGDSALAVERAVVASPWDAAHFRGGFRTHPWARAYLDSHATSVRAMTGGGGGSGERRPEAGGGDRSSTRREPRGHRGVGAWKMPRDGRAGDQPIHVEPAPLRGLIRALDRHLATAGGVERKVRALARRFEPSEVRLVDAAAERELHRTLDGLTRSEGRNLPALERALARDEAFVLSALADFAKADEGGRGALLDRILHDDPRTRGGRDGHREEVMALLAPPARRSSRIAHGPRPLPRGRTPDRSSDGDRRPSNARPARQRMGPATPPAGIRRHGNGRIPTSSLQSIGGGERLAAPAAEAFTAMAAAARRDGIQLPVNDGYRSRAEQATLVNSKGLWSASNPTGAAPVGRSNHGWGLSADINVDARRSRWLQANAARWGFFNDVPGEAWHWTYRPAR